MGHNIRYHDEVPEGVWHFLDFLRGLYATSLELQERAALLNRPWEEEFLHWGADGRLHGDKTPPPGAHSTTSTGWCPGCGPDRRDPR